MAKNPLGVFSQLWKAINSPTNYVRNKMFNAIKKPVYSLAYHAGVGVGKLADFLKAQGAHNIPANVKTDIDQYYRQLASAKPLGKLDRFTTPPSNLITSELMRRERKYRYIVDAIKIDGQAGTMETDTFSFYHDKLLSVSELQSVANERMITIEQYAGQDISYEIQNYIAVLENPNYIELT